MCNVVVLVLLVLISWKEASCSTVIPINEQPKCQQHVLTQCSGLNYSTALRNFRGQSNPTDIENEFLQFEILFRYNCSNALLVLLCSVYAPICISDHDGKSVILKPCRNLCEHVYDGCTLIFQEFNYPWPVFLECSKFPSRNDSDEPCFGPPDPMTIPYPDLVSPNSTIPLPGQSGWSVWTATMQCTSPCIDGIRTVERRCIGEGHCIGNSTKTVSCGSSTCVKPDITEISPDYTVIPHNAGTFYCTATGKPLVAIRWLKDGSSFDGLLRPDITITYSTTGSNCSNNDTSDQCVKSSRVYIYNATSKDSGNYTCVASNDYGLKSESLHLTVKAIGSDDSYSIVIAITTSAVLVVLCSLVISVVIVIWKVRTKKNNNIKIMNMTSLKCNNNIINNTSDTVVKDTHQDVSKDDIAMKLKELTSCMINYSDLHIQEMICEGVFGVVYKGIYSRNGIAVEVAIKTIRYEAGSLLKAEELIAECSTTKRFDHPNVMSIIGVTSLPEGTVPMMVLPLMFYGDVKSFLKSKRRERIKVDEYPMNLSHEVLAKICLDIAKGMDYLSSMRLVHRDLAARNCMLDEDMTAKVGDFGLSRDTYISDYYKLNHNAPLPVKWLAPEALFDKIFTTKSDVWSFGITCWEVFALGLQPYATVDTLDMGTYLMKGNVLDKPSLSSDEMYDVMLSCWKFTAEDRPNFCTLSEDISQQMQ
ncbi:insulin-like growth factor 1 receptor [Dysidea avara]|uniref:insulin-like growth factor 1 receptor n=1 Tax=Dysidea avara TaxID=196820 RepID=UPI0033335C6E